MLLCSWLVEIYVMVMLVMLVVMCNYFVTISILLAVLPASVRSLQEQTSKDTGCSATSRDSSSAVVSDDHSGATPTESATPSCVSRQDETRTNQMVKIESETFIMGTDKPIMTADGEGPARRVTVDTFWMDVHEVSNAEFMTFVDATGYVTEVNNYCTLAYIL